MMTVGDVVRINARHLPNATALVEGDRRVSWNQLNEETNQLAHALASRGVGHGDRVAVLSRVSVAYTATYFAAAKLGAIVVPLNFWHRAEEHHHIVRDSAPVLVLHEGEYAGVLDEVPALDGVPRVVMPTAGVAGSEEWSSFLSGHGSAEPGVRVAPDAPHMIMYTSGTTGQPKGAALPSTRTVHGNLGMSLGLRLRTTDVFLNHFPSFHASCWDHMMTFMLVGAASVLQRQYEPGEMLELVARERVTVLLGLPTMLQKLVDHPGFADADVSSVRLIYFGAYDPSGTLDRVADLFGARQGRIEMAHTYGLTESAPFVTLCRAEDVFSHWGTIGRPLPGVEVELRDDDGRPVPTGEPGELVVRSVQMSGYWNNPEATAEMIEDGWMKTGDIAVSDPDGFLRIVDRKKDVVRSGGHNIYSKQIEDCLSLHEAVAEVAVIGLPDPVWEEAVCAVVVPQPGHVPSDDAGAEALRTELQEFVRGKLAGFNVPRRVEFLDALPKTSVGKTQKKALRDRFGSVFDVKPGTLA